MMALGVASLGRPEFARLARGLGLVYLLPVPWFVAVHLVFELGTPWRIVASFGALAVTAVLYWWRFGEDFRGFFRPPAQQ